ncbi:MAG: hypothetical protein Q4F49_05480 [Pseudoxanthomonas suwonensis]|nr:hypothetical protein [Pseudoxanthomonas suwonensis]
MDGGKAGRQLALFDFDHTLTHGDSHARFLRSIAHPSLLLQARWRIGRWVLGYRAGLVSAAALRARVTQLVFTGHDADAIASAGLHACGDSSEDRPMLALAHERWYRGKRLA